MKCIFLHPNTASLTQTLLSNMLGYKDSVVFFGDTIALWERISLVNVSSPNTSNPRERH